MEEVKLNWLGHGERMRRNDQASSGQLALTPSPSPKGRGEPEVIRPKRKSLCPRGGRSWWLIGVAFSRRLFLLGADLYGFREAFPTEWGVLDEAVLEVDGGAFGRTFAPNAGRVGVPESE